MWLSNKRCLEPASNADPVDDSIKIKTGNVETPISPSDSFELDILNVPLGQTWLKFSHRKVIISVNISTFLSEENNTNACVRATQIDFYFQVIEGVVGVNGVKWNLSKLFILSLFESAAKFILKLDSLNNELHSGYFRCEAVADNNCHAVVEACLNSCFQLIFYKR